MNDLKDLGNQSQSMNNSVGNVTFGDGKNEFTFAPTQIIQISADKIKLDKLNPISPYRGLKPFENDEFDSNLFFGRDELILRLMKNLNSTDHNLVLLFGASGSGKSSVIKAGLIPQLRKNLGKKFCEIIFKPDRDPFLSLFAALLVKVGDQSKASIALSRQPETLREIVSTLNKPEDYWLIYIDQFEELFTSSEPDKRDNFIQGLGLLHRFLRESQRQSVKIVMTMRADFIDRFDPFPVLGEITRGNMELLTTMYEDELRQAIEQPAAKHGVVFEDGLVKRIIEDIKGQSGSLPLLQYTLDLLWKRDNIADPNDLTKPHPYTDRELNIDTYNSLGGVRGALQSHIEDVYTQKLKTPEQQEATKQIFLKLIQWTAKEGGQYIPVSRRRFRSDFEIGIEAETLDIFINERLIVSNIDNFRQKTLQDSLDNKQQATVEIAHEILISAWERLKEWIGEAKDVLIAKSQLQADMNRYVEVLSRENEEKAKDELLMGSRLERILELRANRMFELIQLSDEEAKFIDQSIEWRDRNNQIKEARNLVFFVNDLMKKDLTQAIGMAQMAYCLDPRHTLPQVSAAIFTAYYNAIKTKSSFYVANLLHEADVIVVKYSPDGQKILTASTDGTAKLWKHNGKLIKTMEQNATLRNASFSHNGSKIITVGDEHLVKMWDGDGNFIKDLVGHGDGPYVSNVNGIAFSPDDQTIVTVSADHKVIMWDGQGNMIAELRDHTNIVVFTVFSPDGNYFVTCGVEDSSAKIYSLDGQLIASLEMDEASNPEKPGYKEHGYQRGITSAAFSPDSQLLVTTSHDHTVKMWNINGNHIKTLRHEKDVNLVMFSPDGKFFATASSDRTAIIWDKEGNKHQVLKGHEDSVTTVTFSKTGRQIATGSTDSTAKLWDVEEGTLLSVYKAHNSTINSLAFSPCGSYLVTASTDRTSKIWKVDPIKQINFSHENQVIAAKFPPPDGSKDQNQVIAAKFLPPDGSKVITASNGRLIRGSYDRVISDSNDLEVRLWDANTGNLIRVYRGFGADRYGNRLIHSLDVSNDGKYFLTTSRDYEIRIWDLASGEIVKSWDGGHSTSCNYGGACGATNARYSPDGQYIITSDFGGKVKLWNNKGDFPKEPKEYEGHLIEVNGIDISKDNKYIATGSHDKTIKLWDFATGKLLHVFEGHKKAVNQVNFAPDGNSIISASEDQTSKLWDLQGNIILDLKGHADNVRSAAFSPCGQYIITSSHDKKAKIWNLKGEIVNTLEGHTEFLRSAYFSPSGNNVVTASEDKTAKLWKLAEVISTELSQNSLEICPIVEADLENYGFDIEIFRRAGCLSNSQTLQSQEDIPTFDSQASAKSFYDKALQLIRTKELGSALTMLDQAISSEADYIQAYFQRGVIFYQIKRYPDAIKDLTKVLENQHLADAYFCRGLCYQQINNPEKARSDWQTANKIYEKKITNSPNARKVKDLLNHQ